MNSKKHSRNLSARILLFAVTVWFIGGFLFSACHPVVARQDGDAKTNDSAFDAVQLLEQQAILATQFDQLEKKLFELYQMERDSRPQRAELLRQMYELSQQKNTTARFNEIVQLIRTKQLRLAQQSQQDALSDLKSMMEILQKEDESQRLRDEKKRQQENLREIKRLLQKQMNLRTDALQSEQPASLTEQQQALAEDAQALKFKLEAPNAENRPTQESEKGQGENPENKSSEGQGVEKGSSKNSVEEPGKDPKNGSDEKSAESSLGETEDSQSESNGEETENAEADSSQSDQDPSSDENSLSKRVKSAQQKMQQAKRALDDAKSKQAADQMQEAIEQLEAAKKELEAILKQSREEEMMSTLARLEDQFRQMLETQMRVNQKTLQMDQVPQAVRGPDHEIAAAKLAGEQRKNAMAALRAAMVLRDDSSSVALAVTVEQLNEDMTTVGDRLIVADTSSLTQQFENDIVETLEMLIQSVVKSQEDIQKQSQQSPSQEPTSSDPGEMPLVDQIAELKMLKGLQERILKRHRIIASQLNTDQLPLGQVSNSDAMSLMKKLEQQQSRLFQMTREMVKQIK